MSNFWHDLLFPLYFFVVFIAAHIALYIMIFKGCLLYTSPSPRDRTRSRMPSSA